MELYEQDAVFTNASGAHVGPEAIRSVLRGNLDTGASIRMNDSVAFEAGDLALVHGTSRSGRRSPGRCGRLHRRKSTDTDGPVPPYTPAPRRDAPPSHPEHRALKRGKGFSPCASPC